MSIYRRIRTEPAELEARLSCRFRNKSCKKLLLEREWWFWRFGIKNRKVKKFPFYILWLNWLVF